MKSVARVDLFGYIGKDAEMRFTQSGNAVATFSLGVNVRVQQGQAERTNWYRCTIMGPRAEKLQEHLLKGTAVHARGDLDAREWTSREGETRTSLDVFVQELDFLSSKGDGDKQRHPFAGGQAESLVDDSALPF